MDPLDTFENHVGAYLEVWVQEDGRSYFGEVVGFGNGFFYFHPEEGGEPLHVTMDQVVEIIEG